MYNEDITFHSDRNYPTIVDSDSMAFSMGSGGAAINVAAADTDEEFLIIAEVGGWRYPCKLFYAGGRVYALPHYSPDGSGAISGTLYWRKYGDKS